MGTARIPMLTKSATSSCSSLRSRFLAKCGMDAVQYLKFQRHLIIFVFIMTVICVGIILPINFQVTWCSADIEIVNVRTKPQLS